MSSRAIVRVQGKDIRVGNNAQVGKTTDWRRLVAVFVSSQDVKQSSRDLYNRTLSQFFKWVEETGRQLSQMSRLDILEYKDHLTEEGLAVLTINSYIVSVRKFYEWAESEKLYPNIAKGVKTEGRGRAFKKQHLTDGKSSELLSYFEQKSLRDFAIVNLILRTGLRTIEVVRADIGDITFKGERRILKIWGKGHSEKDDFVVLSDKAYIPIANYLATRKGAKAGEPLFVSNSRQNRGERLTTRTISHLCKEGLQAVGLDGKEFTAHSLRHTAGCAMLKHGCSLYDVQMALRHTDPKTTEEYLKSIEEDTRLRKPPVFVLDEAF